MFWSLVLYLLFGAVSLVVVLASLGKSIGIRELFIALLVKIFEVGLLFEINDSMKEIRFKKKTKTKIFDAVFEGDFLIFCKIAVFGSSAKCSVEHYFSAVWN